jgi:hypothetical protein
LNTQETLLPTLIAFLESIGITVQEAVLPHDTFLPGISIQGQGVLIDRAQLKYPGDLLHEAGHIAVTEANKRPLIGSAELDDSWPTDGEEIAAILWSYAAAIHLNLPPEVVFHPNGYKNDSAFLIEQFSRGTYIGLPLLEWMGLCSKEEFPEMKQWLR